MNNPISSNSQLSITPLGAGDLIDRAVRLYRKNFWTFIWIAAPPVVVGTLISIGWTMLGRALFFSSNLTIRRKWYRYYIFTWLGGMMIWLVETVAVLTVMGGASRNFVRHLLFDEPITFRETYKNTRKRVFGLIGASIDHCDCSRNHRADDFLFRFDRRFSIDTWRYLDRFKRLLLLAVVFSIIIGVATTILTLVGFSF